MHRVPLEVHCERGQTRAEEKSGLVEGLLENDRVLLQLQVHRHQVPRRPEYLHQSGTRLETGLVSGPVHTVGDSWRPQNIGDVSQKPVFFRVCQKPLLRYIRSQY